MTATQPTLFDNSLDYLSAVLSSAALSRLDAPPTTAPVNPPSEVHGTCRVVKREVLAWCRRKPQDGELAINDKHYAYASIVVAGVPVAYRVGEYQVVVDGAKKSCTCPDALHRRRACKHQKAVLALRSAKKL